MFNVKVSFKTTEWQNIVALDVWALAYFPPPCIKYINIVKNVLLTGIEPGFSASQSHSLNNIPNCTC